MIKPKLRFPEFSDSWENYKIEDIFDRVGEPVILDDHVHIAKLEFVHMEKGFFIKKR